jgi:alpha-L-rhamnosidase
MCGMHVLTASALEIRNPRCEYRVNPLGIDVLNPRLSWELESDGPTSPDGLPASPRLRRTRRRASRGIMQKSYRVLVASSEELLKRNEGDAWDSGVVQSDRSIQIEYAGKPLQSKTPYFWKVRVKTSDDAEAESEVAAWSMGILQGASPFAKASEDKGVGGQESGREEPGSQVLTPEGWQAKWIGLDDNASDDTYEQEVAEGKLVIKKAVLKGQRKSIDVTGILNSRIDKGTLGTTCTPEALGVEDPGGRKQLTVKYAYNGRGCVKQTPRDSLLGDIYLPDATMYMDTPEGQEERRRWPVPRQLRREIEIEKSVKRATLYVTALGLYEFRINGQRVGDQILAPEWTDYNKRVQYQTYDVTDLVSTGQNAMAALLGNGWYCGGWMFWQKKLKAIYGKDPSLLAQLELEYDDGSTEAVVTDESWRGTTDGPIRFSGIFEGEIYDARREMPGWDQAGFDASAWKPVMLRGEDLEVGQLVWQRSEPIRKSRELKPVAITEPRPGVYVADMGQVFSGWTRLRVHAQAGTRITMQHGEILNPDGTVYIDNLRAGHFGKGDRQVDRYFCKGSGVEVFEPHFTYHGYRFVELHGLPHKPTAEEVTGIVFHTDFSKQSQFACSNPLLTKFVQNIQWSMRANIMGIPTDCNQRDERCGYTGDMNFFMPAALYNFDLAAFFSKWLVDVEHAQMPGGWFPDHAPYYGPGPGPNVGWSDAGVLCNYRMFREYGDTAIIREHYDSMTKALNHLIRTINPNGTRGGRNEQANEEWRIGLTDHAKAPGGNKVSILTTGTAYLAYNARVMARMATAIGNWEDAAKYQALAEQTRKAFVENLIDESGRVDSDSQTGYALAFTMGLVPEEKTALVSQRFGERVEKVGHIATGFMGCPRVLQGLCLAGRPQDAYQLLLNEGSPSWLYMAKHGTTIWEHFNSRRPDGSPHSPSMNSFSHYAHGAAGAFIFSHIGGIRPAAAGYKRITIKPVIEEGLDWANTRYDSIHGPIETRWRVADGTLTLNVTIPPNTTAIVHMPAKSDANVYEGGVRADQAEGVKFLRMEDGHALFEVGSGVYQFTYVEHGL